MDPDKRKRGRRLQEFVAHDANVRSLAIGKKSGRVLVTGGNDRKVNLWAVGKQTPVLSLSGHTSAVEAVQIDSEEVLVLSGSSNGSIKLWDSKETKGVVVRSLTGHRSSCTAVEFHPFGKFFGSGSSDTDLKIWDVRRKGCLHTYKGHRGAIKKIRFSPDGRWVVTGGADNIVKVWDLTAGKHLHDFKFHSGEVNCIDFHPQVYMLATGSADRRLSIWDLETFESIGYTGPESIHNGVRSVVFHPDGKTILCGLDQSLKVFSWEPIRCHGTVDMGWSNLADLSISEGTLLGCSYHERRVCLWTANIPVLRKPQELSVPIVHEDSRYMELNVLKGIVDGSEESSHLNLPDGGYMELNVLERIVHGSEEPSHLNFPDGGYMELNVLERIVDGSEEPSHLNLLLLQSITENFSIERKIGNGGCGEVYKGILRNGFVAVKRLFKNITIKDKMFHREVKSLITVKHENIVRFLGYCSFTEERVMPVNGGNIMVDIRERLLCFEYISNGSLENHIKDELRGLEWHTRYKIIVGICKGLLYLHSEKNIIHMDLKPANILLDDQMVPKITDFGLARLDDNSQTTTTRFVSLGYSAPEYLLEGKSSRKADIYSLGVIIIELVTGSKKQPNIVKVLRKWRHRWHKSSAHIPLGYQQLTKCLLLGLRCTQVDPADRPGILDVIDVINEIDSNKDEQFQVIPCLEDMLDIKPLEIQFPFALDQQISHSIQMTNDTDDYIAFRIAKVGLPCLRTEPNEGIVPPQSNFGATLTMEAQDKALPNTESWEKLTVQSARVDASLAATHITGDMFMETDSKVVDEVNVTVVFCRPPLQEES